MTQKHSTGKTARTSTSKTNRRADDSQRYLHTAQAVLRLLDANKGEPPNFLIAAVIAAIDGAARAFSIPLDVAGSKGYNPHQLAQLFRIAETYTPESPDLAELLARLLAHPDLPADLYGPFSDALMEIYSALDTPQKRALDENPERLRAILAAHVDEDERMEREEKEFERELKEREKGGAS